jgi:hypothetical protein
MCLNGSAQIHVLELLKVGALPISPLLGETVFTKGISNLPVIFSVNANERKQQLES